MHDGADLRPDFLRELNLSLVGVTGYHRQEDDILHGNALQGSEVALCALYDALYPRCDQTSDRQLEGDRGRDDSLHNERTSRDTATVVPRNLIERHDGGKGIHHVAVVVYWGPFYWRERTTRIAGIGMHCRVLIEYVLY